MVGLSQQMGRHTKWTELSIGQVPDSADDHRQNMTEGSTQPPTFKLSPLVTLECLGYTPTSSTSHLYASHYKGIVSRPK